MITDLRPMWEAICTDLGINPRLVCVHFLMQFEAQEDLGLCSWGAVIRGGEGKLPEVVVVFPYMAGKNGLHLDIVEFRNTCYHELIHLLLRDEIGEGEVEKMAVVLNHRQNG